MYVPKIFEAPSTDAVEQFINENGFAILTGHLDGAPIATHTPLMISESSDGNKTLVGHISVANPQVGCFDGKQELMAIFREHHSYVSSSWYDHVNVPTWNYVAVHVYGTITKIEGENLYNALDQLSNKYEGDNPKGFNIRQMPKEMLERDMKGIVGFEMNVSKVIGNYKLSQNRDDKNYFEIIKKLEQRGDDFSVKIAEDMKQLRNIEDA